LNAGIMDEKVLELVFRALNWDPQSLCVTRAGAPCRSGCYGGSSASHGRPGWWRRGWGAPPRPAAGRICGGWPARAKLLVFCCGAAEAAVPGHFAPVSRIGDGQARGGRRRHPGPPPGARESPPLQVVNRRLRREGRRRRRRGARRWGGAAAADGRAEES
ncbi:hypothetical protein BAE44_0013243, partial [Dichanthelium oligosanthes]